MTSKIFPSTAMQWTPNSPTQLTVSQPANMYIAIPFFGVAIFLTIILVACGICVKGAGGVLLLMILMIPLFWSAKENAGKE
jgi:hypothetical protein